MLQDETQKTYLNIEVLVFINVFKEGFKSRHFWTSSQNSVAEDSVTEK